MEFDDIFQSSTDNNQSSDDFWATGNGSKQEGNQSFDFMANDFFDLLSKDSGPTETATFGFDELMGSPKKELADEKTPQESPFIPTEGLVAYYPFDGDTNDYSGNGNHGTIIGDVVPAPDRHGNPQGAYRFPGEPFNYISVRDAEVLHLSSFTLSAWVFSDAEDYGSGPRNLPVLRPIINKGRDIINGSYRLNVNGVGAQNLYEGSNDANVDYIPQVGQWHMITGTVKGNQARLYIDGKLQAETALSNPFSYGNSDPLAIGMHYYPGVPPRWAYPFKGVIDEVRIYNRAFSPLEVNSLYNYDERGAAVSVGHSADASTESLPEQNFGEFEIDYMDETKLNVVINHNPSVNFAMQQNRVPLLKEIRVRNVSNSLLSDMVVEVTSDPEFATRWTCGITELSPMEEVSIVDIPLAVSASYLAQLTEGVAGSLRVRIRMGKVGLYDHTVAVDLDAFDQWRGLSIEPKVLASFVQPKHPALPPVLVKASAILEKWSGSPSFDEYQTRDPNRVKLQMAAVFSALAELKVVNVFSAVDYTRSGDKLRFPDAIIDTRMASDLDMALLYASLLEAIGLHALIAFSEDAILVGSWLIPDCFADTAGDDVSLLSKRLSKGIEELSFVSVKCLFSGSAKPFDKAADDAAAVLSNVDKFLMVIDVCRARMSHIRPLPLRVMGNNGYEIVVEEGDFEAERPMQVSAGNLVLDDGSTEVTKQTIWERRLLDLTLRNNLLSTRINKKTLQIVSVKVDEIEDALAANQEFKIMECPEELVDLVGVEGIYQTPNNSDAVIDFLREELKQNRLHSYLKKDDLESALTHLYRQSRLSIEENGANTLYLAIGLLRWYETPVSTKPRFAPILLLPIEMVRKSAARGYIIRGRGEETMLNITLLELLRQSFGITISGLDPLPTDHSGVDVVKVFNTFRNAIMEQTRWDVEEQAIIGTFSFNKFLMWNDIHNNVDVLRQNKIVNGLITGQVDWGDDLQGEMPDLDQTFSVGDLALPMPADSSQIEAISAALGGKSFVLHGPPGTGKSQTITNIIANGLYQGKKILFVAEKMAALQVVQKRLEAIGLAPFCLELHSNKAKKSVVIEQLKRTVEVTKQKSSQQFQKEASQLNALRNEINEYVTALHRPYPIGRSLYDCFSDYSSVAEFTSAELLPFESVESLKEEDLQKYNAWLHEYVSICSIIGDVSNAPLRACKNSNYQPSLKSELQANLVALRDDAEACRSSYEAYCNALGLTFSDRLEWMASLQDFVSKQKDGTMLPEVLRSSAFDADIDWTRRLIAAGKAKDGARQVVCEHLGQQFLNADVEQMKQEWQAIETFMEGYPVTKSNAGSGNLSQPFTQVPQRYQQMMLQYSVVAGWFGLENEVPSVSRFEQLKAVLNSLLEMHLLIPDLFSESTKRQCRADLSDLIGHVEKRNQYRDQLLKRFRPTVFDLNYIELQNEWVEASSKSFISKKFGQSKVLKKVNVHALSEVSEEEMPDLLVIFRGYWDEVSCVYHYSEWAKKLMGYEWKEGSFDIAMLRKAMDVHTAIHGQLLSMTQDERKTAMVESALVACVGNDVQNFHAMKDVDIHRFIRSFEDFVAQYQEFNKHGVPSATVLATIERYQRADAWLTEHQMQGNRLFGSLWQPDACQWGALEQSLSQTSDLCASIAGLEQDAEKQSAVRMKLAASLEQGGMGNVGTENAVPNYQEMLSSLQAQSAECNRLLCGEMIAIDDNNFFSSVSTGADFVLQHLDELKDACKYNEVVNSIPDKALQPLVDKVENGTIDGILVGLYYKKCFARTYSEYILSVDPLLSNFHGKMFEEKITYYKHLCQRFEKLTREELYAKLASNMPNFQVEAAGNSEVGILQRNIRNGARGMSLRSLFDKIPDLLTRICPCMLMSPISVAQYIDARGAKFDYVIFDEASQMPTCEAVGTIARGKNVIVVGDPKQLPPTSFFEANAFDEDNADKEDLESILDDCLALSMPSKYLLWHYRSKHESLIAFSNMRYYGNKLMTFPSPDDLTTKVSFQYVDGIYDKGRTRQNREEAVAVVEEIRQRLSDPVRARQSIGVVTFNTNQQSLIEDLLNNLFRQDPKLEKIALDREEPLFVKNLENVQGDERDVILFSVGYGADKMGRVSMNFGPLNRDGGWRRLNVAVSRARYEMKVFSTLTPDQIDLNRSSAQGVAGLRAFLEYAQNGRLSLAYETANSKRTSDYLVLSVAEEIRMKGYEVRTNIGSSGYRVDIGVVDPQDRGKFVLGILCDGYNYATAKSARDREITRGMVLKLLGWRISRVWAMEWWESHDAAFQKLMSDIEKAISGKWDEEVEEITPEQEEMEEEEVEEIVDPKAVPYVKAELPAMPSVTPDEVIGGGYAHTILKIFDDIIRAEAPVSKKTLIRRTNATLGIARAGQRLAPYYDALLRSHGYPKTVYGEDIFYWNVNQDPSQLDLYRPESDRDPMDIAPEEVMVAVCQVLDQQGALPEQDLLRQAAKRFRFSRLGDNVVLAMRRGVELAWKSGKVIVENERVKLVQTSS